MRKSPIVFLVFILFLGCYTTTRNPNQSAYYDGFRESESAEADEAETEVVYESGGDVATDKQYYSYDPYYMNRYMITRYDHAWYWRGMYRPYEYRHHRNFSIYFGYSSGPIWNSWYDYYSYDPYYDYYWNDYSYWNDYYSPYHNYYGSIYRPYSYYPRTVVYVTDGGSQPSYERRGYNRLGQTSGGISSPNPNPVPYYLPNIAVITPSNKSKPGSSSVRIQKVKKLRALESDHKERSKYKSSKTRSVKKQRKETSKSSPKKSSVSSSKRNPRREVTRTGPRSNPPRKSTAVKSKSKSKKSDD